MLNVKLLNQKLPDPLMSYVAGSINVVTITQFARAGLLACFCGGTTTYRSVNVLHLPYDLLGQVQVQVHVLLLAADGVVALTPGAASNMLTKLPAAILLLTPRVWQIG